MMEDQEMKERRRVFGNMGEGGGVWMDDERMKGGGRIVRNGGVRMGKVERMGRMEAEWEMMRE